MIDMNILEDVIALCPYCSQPLNLLIDRSFNEQSYSQDCQVCCNPMIVNVEIDKENNITLTLIRENE